MGNVNVIRDYFELLKETLDCNELGDKPKQIYNCDEAALFLNKSAGQKVVVPVRFKNSHSVSCATSEHVSVHCCVNAAGNAVPPMMIFTRTLPGGAYHREGPVNASYACSENGFMDQNLYLQWFEKTFLAHAVPKRPLLLIQDGASSHMSAPLIRSAIANDVVIMCLPPKTTHITQPLDVAVYRKMKLETSKVMRQAKMIKSDLWVAKRNISGVFKVIFERSFTMSCITEGFKKCGIFPFNPNAIDKSLLLRSNTETNLEDLDLSPRPKPKASTSVTNTATSDASKLAQSPDPATEETIVNSPDLPANSQYVVDNEIPSGSLSEDFQIVTESESIMKFLEEPLVMAEPTGIPDVNDSFTALNVDNDISSPLIGKISLLIDENGIVSVNPSPTKSGTNTLEFEEQQPENPNVTTCPPELALAAVECGITPKKKRKYESSFNLGSDFPNNNCFQTWKVLKSKVAENEIVGAKCEADNKAVDENQNVINHPLVKAGLISSDLVDVLVVLSASTGQKAKAGKRIKKARVLTSDEVQKELEEREKNLKEKEEAKVKRKQERELKRVERETLAAKKKEELRIKRDLKEKAKAEKNKPKTESVKAKVKKIQEERETLLKLRKEKSKEKILLNEILIR